MFLGLLSLAVILTNYVGAQSYSGDYFVSGMGGFSCTNVTCLNGICTDNDECLCLSGYSGGACDLPLGFTRFYLIQQTIFSVALSNSTFGNAAEECQGVGIYGRIVSNVSSPSVKEKLSQLWARLMKDVYFFETIRNESFWVITGEYTASFPDLSRSKALCTTLNISGHLEDHPCSDSFFTLCETPVNGSCYPEVAKQCSPPKDICTYVGVGEGIVPRMWCHCRDGFEVNDATGICEDVNECESQRATDCYNPTICQNTLGSYRCGCKDGKQGNGNDTCAYVLTLEHRNIDFTKIPVRTFIRVTRQTSNGTTGIISSRQVQWTREQFETKVKSIFSRVTNSVEKVVVKTLSLTNYSNSSVTYDVYVGDSSISTTSLKEFYLEADRQNATDWLKGSRVSEALLSCTESTFRLGRDFSSNFYTFPAGKPGTTVSSIEKCPDGRSRSTIECRTKENTDGGFTSFLDYRTVLSVPCQVSTTTVQNQFQAYKSPETAQICMSDFDSLTADYTNASPELFSLAVDSMKEVAEYVWNSNVEISVDTMRSILNVANNINEGQKYSRETGGDFKLSDTQRRDIVRSLLRCSTNVDIEASEQITMKTDSVVLQVSNLLSKPNSSERAFPQGIFFKAGMLNQNDCPMQNSPSTQAAINEDILAEAKKIKREDSTDSLQASVVYFTDSEFFPSNTYDYEVEQVLSLRISNLKLDSLERPVWFKIPPKQREQNENDPGVSYYKCAYFEEETEVWLSDGCEMIPGSNPPNCTCDHMTNFAVLVQRHPQVETYGLDVFGKIFCSISIISLILTLLIHLYFPNLRCSQVVKIHCNLALCLLLAYTILLTSTERPRPHNVCIASALFLHFFLLSSWGWMLVECVTMYKKLVAVFSMNSSHYVTKSAIVVYCLAAVFAILTLLVAVVWYDNSHFEGWSNPETDFVPSVYVSDRFCWLQSYPLIIGFLIPIGILFIVNLIGSIFIMRAITWGRQKVTSSAKDKLNFRSYFIRTVTISVLLGLCWVFAIPLTLTDDPTVNAIFGWLFTITNALQGFFIFLFSCVTREDVRKLWLREIEKFFRGGSQQKESKLLTDDSGKDTREMTTTDSRHESSRKTVTTKLEEETEETKELAKENKISKDHFQMGEVSSFHPKGKESSEDVCEELDKECSA